MYTEDDDKVVVNKDSNNYSNFYTSFMNNEKKKKKKDTKKTAKKNNPPKEEDYSNFYDSFLESEKLKNQEGEEPKQEDTNEYSVEDDYPEVYNYNDSNKISKKNIIIIVGVALAIIILILLLFLLQRKKADIILNNEEININVGESAVITYQIVNTDDTVTATYSSSNQEIVIVDSNGQVTGIAQGETEVIVYYRIGSKTSQKKCKVIVTGVDVVDKKISLVVSLKNVKDNKWSNKDAIINVNADSVYGIESIKYAINCNGDNCNYNNVGDSITISNNGVSKVTIVTKDMSGQQTSKNVTIKIDKEAPKVIFNSGSTITGTDSVNVCATCSDSISGCKKDKVCVKYTSSKTNQRITVEDNAGNKASTPTFDVKINKSSNVTPCTLSVDKNGKVTAKVMGGATYYGFDSSYSGTNTTSKTISIKKKKKGESMAKLVYYYVKDNNGNKYRCNITVIKECKCKDGSNSSNCTVACTFRAG